MGRKGNQAGAAAAGRKDEKTTVRRRRGQLRLQSLIEAANALLREHDVGEVGLYQIAERAGVPAASIYHFFPNKEAALVAVAEDYLDKMMQTVRRELDPPPSTWQELIVARIRLSSAYYNDCPPLMKLFLGASISAEVRRRDMAGTVAMGQARMELLDHYFAMPKVPDWAEKVTTSIALCDGIWALSYSEHGYITPAAIAEAERAVVAYLRCYLPEWVEPRRPGQTI